MSSSTTSPDGLDPEMHKVQAAWEDASIAERYANSENATRPFAKVLVEKTDLATRSEPANVFDLATGTGAAVKELYDAVPKEKWDELKILGGDVSSSMLSYLKGRGEKEGWKGLETRIVDGNRLEELVGSKRRFTHILCTFAIFVLPTALPHLYTLASPGGYIGISTWTHLPWHAILSRSITRMSSPQPYCPSAHELEAKMFSGRAWGEEAYVGSQLREAGFVNVQTEIRKEKASVGSAKLFMESMQLPLMIVKGFWLEEKQEAWIKELNEVMYKEVVKVAGGEDGVVEMEFEAILAWAWKEKKRI